MYGEYDNFNLEASHVVPAMIRKFIEAREKNAPACRSSARAVRRVISSMRATWRRWCRGSSPITSRAIPSTFPAQRRTSIRELAATIGKLTGYRGEIFWDTSHPDGQMVKIYDAARLRKLGLCCPTPLVDGLKRTIQWFEANRDGARVRL